MSKDIIVLTPNGRRQKIHCTPDTSILQVLEDVCQKQGYQAGEYELKHHNKTLDLSTTVRFSNLPNKAMLELVETDRKREETNITIGLLLEDGERRTADFPPNTSLYDLVTSLAPSELGSLQQPTISYMRQEVVGEPALRGKTLRQLGLTGGRAILRLLNKTEEPKQANVSAIYRRSQPQKQTDETTIRSHPKSNVDEFSMPGPSNISKNVDHIPFEPVKLIKEEKKDHISELHNAHRMEEESISTNDEQTHDTLAENPIDINEYPSVSKSSPTCFNQDNLERRLRIEEEVTFLGAQKAVAFMQPEDIEDEFGDLPDDFYELTIAEVRKLYRDLQQHRIELENTPLLTTTARGDLAQTSQQKLANYKNVVVRIQFPDHIILQGVFSPNNTIEDVTNFIREHLQDPAKPFHIFTTPLKETLDPNMTLLEAKFVPCVHMHFKWLDEGSRSYLKEEIYAKRSSSDAASILASKYRAPSRRKMDEASDSSQKTIVGSAASTKSSKVPKWFKK